MKTLRDYINLIETAQQGVAEDDAGDVEQRFAAKMEKEKQRLAKLKQTDPAAYKREMEKRKTSSRIPPVSTFEEQGVAEDSLEEYGDTAKGQKQLTKVHKRAVDRVTSKQADTDPKYAKKNQDTANASWERLKDKD